MPDCDRVKDPGQPAAAPLKLRDAAGSERQRSPGVASQGSKRNLARDYR